MRGIGLLDDGCSDGEVEKGHTKLRRLDHGRCRLGLLTVRRGLYRVSILAFLLPDNGPFAVVKVLVRGIDQVGNPHDRPLITTVILAAVRIPTGLYSAIVRVPVADE